MKKYEKYQQLLRSGELSFSLSKESTSCILCISLSKREKNSMCSFLPRVHMKLYCFLVVDEPYDWVLVLTLRVFLDRGGQNGQRKI